MNDDIDWKQITFDNSNQIAKILTILEANSKDIGKLIRHEAKIDRVITQNNEIKEDITNIRNQISNDKKKLKWLYVIAEYPKISFALALSTYIFAMKDVRDAIGIELKPLISTVTWIKGLFL